LVQVIEALSRADGSIGWSTTIVAQTALLANALLPPKVAAEIFAPQTNRISVGCFVPNGMARLAKDSFSLTGYWKFGTTIRHSAWVASAARVSDGDNLLSGKRGMLERIVLAPTSRFEVHDTWHAMGLRGTGSCDYSVTELEVPREYSFSLLDDPPARPEPLYAFRWMYLVAIAGVPLGVARGAIDEAATRLENGRKHSGAYGQLAQAEALVGSARAYVFDVLGAIWTSLIAGNDLSLRQRGLFRACLCNAFQASAAAVDLAVAAAGGTWIYASDPLERRFRDVHVAASHAQMGGRLYEVAGRMLAGIGTDVEAA
jgi:alkylation response protein AidB-like acyl-CoA dehydrogenase